MLAGAALGAAYGKASWFAGSTWSLPPEDLRAAIRALELVVQGHDLEQVEWDELRATLGRYELIRPEGTP
jgi:hypothetical protein